MCSCQQEALSGTGLGITSTLVTGVAVALATTAATVHFYNKSSKKNKPGVSKYVVPALVGFGVSLLGGVLAAPVNAAAYEL